jgi:uncharacterized membrane protein
MAVFQEQDSGAYRFVVSPNCALSWKSTKYLMWFFAACIAAVGAYFASLGAWLVLPFAGLELAVVVAGFYLSALAGHTREVIEIEGPVVRVLRGRRQLDEVARFPANWTRVALRRDPAGWYPSQLLLRCHGRRLEVAAKVVEAEREELALALENWLGFAHAGNGGGTPEAIRAEPGKPAQELTAGHEARVGFDLGPRPEARPNQEVFRRTGPRHVREASFEKD